MFIKDQSNACIVTKRKKIVTTFLHHMKNNSSYSILTRRMIGGNVPFYLKSWDKLTLLEKNRDFQSIFARSASAVTPSEKFIIIHYTLSNKPKMNIVYVAISPFFKSGSKTKNERFPSKIALQLKNVCYYAVQGHSRSPSFKVTDVGASRSPYATSY